MAAVSLLLLFALTVKPEGAALRAGCSTGDAIIAPLDGGAAVTVKFALAGEAVPCYKVSAVVNGKKIEGYLWASALANAEEFDRLRRTGRDMDLPQTLTLSVRRGVAGSSGADAVELIQRNQPGEALEILEKLLRDHPRDPQLLALAGFAAYRSDDAGRAADYWQQSLDLQPDPRIERALSKVRREMSSDRSSRKSYGSRFLVRYDDAEVSPEMARAMVDALEQEYSRIAAELGCGAQERIPVIVQSPQAYRKTTEAANWSGGQYDGRIHVALFEARSIGPRTRMTFAHELVHACLAEFPGVPAWMNEGLAQRLSGEATAPGRERAIGAVPPAGEAPALASLERSWSNLDAEKAAAAYAISLKAVNLIYDRYSYYTIRNIIRNPDLMRKLTAELDRQTGL